MDLTVNAESPIIELADLTVGYRFATVLTHLNLSIPKGSFTGIVGPTGAGKSTLLKAIMGLVPAASGRVLIDGRPLKHLPVGLIGYVPQQEDIDPAFPITVEQVILLGLARAKSYLPWNRKEEKRRAHEIAEQLGVAQCLHHHIRDVSGGQRQRAFLARALLCNPRILILDEPTAGVDMHTQSEILTLLSEFNANGITVLLTTHDLNSVALALPQIICFNQHIVAQGPPKKVFTNEVLAKTFDANLGVIDHNGRQIIAPREPNRLC